MKSLKSSPVLFTHDDAGVMASLLWRMASFCAGHLKSKDAGLISYAEYLFLLTALVSACCVLLCSPSPRQSRSRSSRLHS